MLMPIFVHKALILYCSVAGAYGGFFLGLYLVHGSPVKGALGWPVIISCALLAFLGFMIPMFLLRMVPASCPRCGGPAFLRTESTFFKKLLAVYKYRCKVCKHAERADFSTMR
jgi:hypothetical protein